MVLFFQELDDVYHESSSVVAETLVQGADVMSLKVRLSYFSARWRSCRLLSCCFPCCAICYSNMHFFLLLLQYNFFSLSLLQSAEMGRRYEKMGQATKLIQPPQDIIAFVKTLHIPETLTVSKHVFSPPQPADPAQVRMKFCPKVCNKSQCPRTNLSKRFLPKPMTTTG